MSVSTDDPALKAAARSLESSLDNDPVLAADVAEVIRSGKSVIVRLGDEDVADDEDSTADELADTDDSAGPTAGVDVPITQRSSITVPLVKRGRVLGALQMVQHDDSRPYGDADLSVAEVAAAHALMESGEHTGKILLTVTD